MIIPAEFRAFKKKSMVVITAYDAPFARRAEAAGVDALLVGDSVANAALGYSHTREVDMDAMALFVGAVARGARNTAIIADMPFGSDETPVEAVKHARRFIQAGAHSVKFEGAKVDIALALTEAGIPVVGHLGLLPQTAKSFKQVGRDPEEKSRLMSEAVAMEKAGLCALVLEHIPADLARSITDKLSIPTIGIGAGQGTDGQVLVLHDALGFSSRPLPPFAKAFAQIGDEVEAGIRRYAEAVRNHSFP